jgi:SAM-dependent methyltransferase
LKKLIKHIASFYVGRVIGFFATMPNRFRTLNKTAPPEKVSHSEWVEYLSENFNKPGLRILEVGSRVVTGSNFRDKFDKAEYVGFDFHDGDNVDVVGDAHKLSSYFAANDRFDLIFSSSVFEHLHMPWVVTEEINKLLKVGGYVFIETHFSYGSHERPWHFFQFSDMGLRALFSDAMGYELIDCGLSNPMVGYFSHASDAYLLFGIISELYCHSEILVRKTYEIENFDWRKIDIDGIVEGTRYPLNNK